MKMDNSDNERRLTLLVATGNQGKVRELTGDLARLPINLKGLNEVADITAIDETGTAFLENAVLKAAGYARQAGLWSLADDSGLEVAALGGAPGVRSARFGGAGAQYPEKIEMLLRLMDESGSADRTARFACAMALSDPTGAVAFTAEGICAGTIADAPRGRGGFGYDPIFVPDGFTATFGELPDHAKLAISHRARALEQIIRYLLDFTGVSLDH